MKYETIIGLEVHVQLKTKSKMFCSCDNAGEDKAPNTTICPICTGQPGALPVPNREAVDMAVRTALALNCTIPAESHFDRKHYYYPDLPKGFQISQWEKPFGTEGILDLTTRGLDKQVRIHELHLEEDAAKLVHRGDWSGVDFNRGGTPLMEIVTKPDLRSAAEAKVYMQELRLLCVYLGVSDADMEKGHLRCDASISLLPEGETELRQRVEIKNLNSFKAVERALLYEQQRLSRLLERGEYQENSSTRSWKEDEGVTEELRSKESAADYRYFPEPDIPPMTFPVERVHGYRAQLPELPWQKRGRLLELGFAPQHILQLVEDKALASYAEEALSELREWMTTSGELEGTAEEIWDGIKEKAGKLVGNWLTGAMLQQINAAKQSIKKTKITPENFAEFLLLVLQRKINSTQAQQLFGVLFERGGEPHQLLTEMNFTTSDTIDLVTELQRVIEANPNVVADYHKGKVNAIQYLVGQIMKATKGAADATEVRQKLAEELGEPHAS
jgi:aspartyl-tRNA(Asn)/glutamyl-tRNA(Gln) amidotransferase subunit B